MALARTYSVALVGVHGHVVEVEADIANGLVGMVLVGLPDTALREARDRIRSAILNSGEPWPQRRITVGLSPASLPKRGSGFDVPIAVALLAAAGVLKAAVLAGMMLLGELGLDGQLRPVPGVLPAAVAAAAAGFRDVVVARANAQEAALVPGLRVLSAPTLAALLAWMRGEPPGPAGGAVEELTGGTITALSGAAAPVPGRDALAGPPGAGRTPSPDLSDVLGQPLARRAAEICAAGGHHLSLLGPPGGGQDDARRAAPHDPARAGCRGGPRSDVDSFGRGHAAAGLPAADRAAVLRAASHRDEGGHRRRGQRHHPARRRVPRAPGRAVPGRGARVWA